MKEERFGADSVKKKKHNQSIISDVSYHDYIALLCYTDAEWSMRGISDKESEDDRFYRSFRQITSNCCSYRDTIEKNYANWFKANHEGKEDTRENVKIKRYLYNPICYVPFGHADDLSIVLLDDFDPIHFLTSDIRTTEEDACLAFCPKIESLVGEDGRGIFCDLHELLKEKDIKTPNRMGDSKTYSPVTHNFQKSTPLLVFTKYKISGLASVGEGLLFQNALYRAMIKTINKVMKEKLEEDWKGWVEPGDVKSMRIALLDLQGPEEIGTLIFCRNYSVAMACVGLLRNLTFEDAFDSDINNKLKNALCRSKIHKTIYETSFQLRRLKKSERADLSKSKCILDVIKDEHMFRWTHSSLALTSEAFINGNHSNCNGFIEAKCEIQMSPGHRFYVENGIENVVDNQGKKPPEVLNNQKAPTWFAIGRADFLFPYTGEKGLGKHPLVATGPLWGTVLKNLRKFRPISGKEKQGRDIVDTETWINVPVPPIYSKEYGITKNLLLRERGKMHYAPLSDLLPKTQERLCYYERQGTMGRLSFSKLIKSHKSYGVPISLRRAIEYLYHNFSTIIADPYLFEVVLDLYDTFATLHAVLTEHLPAKLASEEGRSAEDLGFLDEGSVDQLAMLVEAMHNALTHRIAKTYPDILIRDMAIDYRGGMNQILLSADAVMKCGLGIFRRFVLKGKKENERDIVGVPTRVSFKPGARCHSLEFGTEDKAQLAFFEVDVPHVLHVASYCDYLHESFHLIFNRLIPMKASYRNLDDVMIDRMGEIFAILMTQLFVFGKDVKSSLYHYVVNYSKSLSSLGVNDRDAIVRFTEFMIWLFFALDAVEGAMNDSPLTWSKQKWHRSDKNVKDAVKAFKIMIKKAGPFYTRYTELWTNPKENGGLDAESYCIAEFKSIYTKVAPIMPQIWHDATLIISDYVKALIAETNKKYIQMEKEIIHMIKDGLSSGTPLILSQYYGLCLDNDVNQLDELFLISKMLHSYISRIMFAENKEVHLYRKPSDRSVKFEIRKRKWHDFLIEKGAASMFCPVPMCRRERLRKQIVILKSLWDISTRVRARRLGMILSNNWTKKR